MPVDLFVRFDELISHIPQGCPTKYVSSSFVSETRDDNYDNFSVSGARRDGFTDEVIAR